MSTNPVISPSLPIIKSRTLVLCFDGTTNEYDSDNTNIVNFFSLLKKDDRDTQLCYYQAGIGTFFAPGVVSPMFQWIAKVLDQAIAWYLDQHVMDGYKFICQNYRPGDKICLFGFSRGAYTARAVAGMLYKIGLISKDNAEQINFAYKLYKRTDAEGIELARGFKQTFSQDIQIEFVGVWDTVASVGVVAGKTLPFTDSNSAIRTFRHALALDERRAKFRPNLYHRLAPSPAAANRDPEHASPSVDTTSRNLVEDRDGTDSSSSSSGSTTPSKKRGWMKKKSNKNKRGTSNSAEIDDPSTTEAAFQTDVLEVWFAGCHSDIGGGAVLNTVTSNLAGITLRWMVREILKSQCGIQFDHQALQKSNVNIQTLTTPGRDADGHRQAKLHVDGDNKLGLGLKVNTVTATASSQLADSPSAELDSSETKENPAGNDEAPGNMNPSQGGDKVDQDVVDAQKRSGKESAVKTKAIKQMKKMTRGASGDAVDALQPIHDDLKIGSGNWTGPLWWILEVLPLTYTWQTADGDWKSEWNLHLGRGRDIQDPHPRFHQTVKARMDDGKMSYTPRANYKKGSEVYVE